MLMPNIYKPIQGIIRVEKFFQLLYQGLLIFTLIYILGYPFVSKSATYVLQLPILCTVGLLFLCYILYGRYNIFELVGLAGIIFIILFNYMWYEMPITAELLYHTAEFVSFVILIIASNAFTLNHKILSFTYYICALATLVLLAYSFSSFAHWDTKRYVEGLTLGFYNPNFTGIILFLLYSIIYMCRPKNYSVISFILIGILLYLIMQTHSRTTLLAALLVPPLALFARNKPISNVLICTICSVPFLFVKFYLDLYHRIGPTGTFLGKTLFSGREQIFVNALYSIYEPIHYLVGHAQQDMFSNAHNGPLAIFVSIGIVGSILFYSIFLRRLFLYNKQVGTHTAACAILVLLATFIHSCGEAGLFTGGYPMPVFMFIFFVLAQYKGNNI